MRPFKSTGFLGLQRQGKIVKDGRLTRASGLMLWFHYFKDIPNQATSGPCEWKDGEWHHVAITWRGTKWEALVDGKVHTGTTLARPLKREDLTQMFSVYGNALIDEFTIYRRPLSGEEIERLNALGKVSNSG
ncbi:MAG: hypothetical protein COZ05_19685 [Armatimonadetes bacterium CG_4_10_14_3_um_filter_59_10]|nr:MAG: hypothetical protein COZ05_19685 [Armatimonadetes bacterium CG_4_10_14_3_um_filter_59_10]